MFINVQSDDEAITWVQYSWLISFISRLKILNWSKFIFKRSNEFDCHYRRYEDLWLIDMLNKMCLTNFGVFRVLKLLSKLKITLAATLKTEKHLYLICYFCHTSIYNYLCRKIYYSMFVVAFVLKYFVGFWVYLL